MAKLGSGADETTLRGCLEEIVADRFGSGASIAGIHRTRFPHLGSYDCDSVTVELDDGERLSLFLKDFGFSRLSKDDRELRRVRELRVYRDLLAHADLGTPRYYGSLWDESQARFWLILERVEGTVVEHVDEERGVPAAAWLARLQGHFLRFGDLGACDFLILHDARFFRSKAASARRDVARLSPASSPRLAALLERYDRAVDRMLETPRSLVHGGYIPWHVLLDAGREPARVCAVDWELAALGSTLYDLALFTDGVEPPVRERIERAYRDAAAQHQVPVPEEPEMRRVLDCFRLHRILDWLSRSVEKQFPERKVAKLVAQAERLGDRALD
jgi:aminoglycoside phosphotransferase (APT) family kinase protein